MRYIPRSNLTVERYKDQLSHRREGYIIQRTASPRFYLFGFSSRAAAERHSAVGNLAERFWTDDPSKITFTLHQSLRDSLSQGIEL